MSVSASLSSVERAFVQMSGRRESYDSERIPTIEVQNIYELGKLVALRFLEWVNVNPTGVVALPTGRTPEYFIKTLEHYKANWMTREVQDEVAGFGFGGFPDTSRLTFVMLDEFFPMVPTHKNSFCHYIQLFYLAPLGIKKENVMTFDLLDNGVLTLEELIEFDDVDVDLSLLTRAADKLNEAEERRQTILLKVKAFCDRFEERLTAIGGIGFFLGGIGPDGHIAFNQEGADHSSTTRLVNFNYPTAAAAAGDLGGIEVARGKAAMTIGLRTITANPAATQIIMAAGEGKATVVREALEEPADHKRPASVLHGLPGARFYITQGAAIELTARRADKFAKLDESLISWAANYSSQVWSPLLNLVQPPEEYQMLEGLLYEASLKSKVPVRALTLSHLELFPRVYTALHACFKTPEALVTLTDCAARRLEEKISWGVQSSVPHGQQIIHTAPHHDDIMLSYHPAMHEMLGRAEKHEDPDNQVLGEQQHDNRNYFAYLTSGFHSVNDAFLNKQVDAVRGLSNDYEPLRKMIVDGTIAKDYDTLMADFRIAFFAQDSDAQDYIENVIFLRKIVEVWELDAAAANTEKLITEVTGIIESIRNGYLATHHPGDSIPKEMQLLKGCMRESEVDRVWAVSRMPMDRVYHMRSKFYNDDFFTPMPSLEDDAVPMAELYKKHQPGILTVAFDPEGTGPDTHYKVLLVVAAGLRVAISRNYLEDPNVLVWGYRNVWFVFKPEDATIFIPGTQQDLDLMHDTFMSCFTTQKSASFPSPFYDGPFSAWARQIQINQRRDLGVLLGEDFFQKHPDERVRKCTGFVFIKAMWAQRFLQEVEDLKSKFEVTP